MSETAQPSPNAITFKRSHLCNSIQMGAVVELPDGSFKSCGGGVLTDQIIVEDMMELTDKADLPVLHSGKAYPGGVVIFGKADYSIEELRVVFDRIRTFGYKVADMRPEWSAIPDITRTVTASQILKRANEYEVPSHIVNNFGEVEYLEALNFIRSLWREMDIVWCAESGDPVPNMPTITPNIGSDQPDSTEDQVHNALRTVRAWCASRVTTTTRDSKNKARNEEIYRQRVIEERPAKEVMNNWNANHPKSEHIKVSNINKIISEMKKRQAKSQPNEP